MKTPLLFLAVLSGLIISGCTSSHMLSKNGPLDLTGKPGKAVLITIRLKISYGGAQLYSVYLDRKMIGECEWGTCFRTEIEPGIHHVFVKPNLGPNNRGMNIEQVQFLENKVYYLVLYPVVASSESDVKGEFVKSYEEAKEYMKECICAEYDTKNPGEDYKFETKPPVKEDTAGSTFDKNY